MDIDVFVRERAEVATYLNDTGEITFLNTFNADLPKVLIIAVASRFESDILGQITAFFEEVTTTSLAVDFVKKKALFRQFHTLFDWDTRSANKFFSTFGSDCLSHYKAQAAAQAWLATAAADFLEVGQARNLIVHGNYADYTPSLTFAEVIVKSKSAERFVSSIPDLLRLLPVR